ncbi:MAG: polyphosphate kinase 2 family protein [Oscillochloris sp.]|nr:polyphosphate kinase 2 family protein [Oscillochloris sp.]
MDPLTFKIEPGSTIDLREYDPRYNPGIEREQAETGLAQLALEIDELQELLFGAARHSLLVIMQGMDTSGKDGTVRKVFSQISPLGSYVHGFGVPTPEELSHDFLWRVHKVAPAKGKIGIFNRSHYEDVLVVRVHNLVPPEVWGERYAMINNFEHLLAANNTIILKFFLHISKEEQEERLLKREEETEKAWKLSSGDWRERTYWDEYMAAYEDVLTKCSTSHAPWHLVPADRKWYRNYAVAHVVADTLRGYRDQWMEKLRVMGAEAKADLAAFRQEKGG